MTLVGVSIITIFTQYNVFTAISMTLAFIPLLIMLYATLRGMEDSNLCMDCQQCVAVCPVMKVKDSYLGPRGIMIMARSGNMDKANDGEIFSCTSCMACVNACPRGLNVKHVMDHTRSVLAKQGMGQGPAHKYIIKNATSFGNVYEEKPRFKPEIATQKENVIDSFREYGKIAKMDLGLSPKVEEGQTAPAAEGDGKEGVSAG